jgi:glyoxylase I family protein
MLLKNEGDLLMFKRIDHVELVPSDFDRTITFYSDVLGFSIEERRNVNKPPLKGIAFLKLGDTFLELISVTDPSAMPQDTWLVGYKRIAIEVDDMDNAIDYLKSKGVEVTWGPVELETSIRAEFEDPDGISIELTQWLKTT